MALSEWKPEYRDGWMTTIVPIFEPRRRVRLLAPFGWFIVLSVLSLLMGTVIAFLT